MLRYSENDEKKHLPQNPLISKKQSYLYIHYFYLDTSIFIYK